MNVLDKILIMIAKQFYFINGSKKKLMEEVELKGLSSQGLRKRALAEALSNSVDSNVRHPDNSCLSDAICCQDKLCQRLG